MFNRIAQGTVGALAAVVMLGSPALATPVNTTSNVVFIVDESGSMGGDQDFLENVVIDNLDAGLQAAGVTNRSYGVVGYGGPNSGAPRLRNDSTLDDAATTKANLGTLVTSGGFEDGYAAIDFALNNLNFVAGAAINFILVTDEDRDVTGGSTLNFANIKSALTSRNILLNAVINNRFSSDNNGSVLGIDSDGNGFFEQAAGAFGSDTGGTVGASGDGSTDTDYAALALQTGGAAWDIGKLRAGGNTAASFTSAFIDIKVSEIISQPPSPGVIPLPAGLPLILTGFGALGGLSALRRRKKATA